MMHLIITATTNGISCDGCLLKFVKFDLGMLGSRRYRANISIESIENLGQCHPIDNPPPSIFPPAVKTRGTFPHFILALQTFTRRQCTQYYQLLILFVQLKLSLDKVGLQ